MTEPLPRLNDRTLARVKAGARLPSYDRKRLATGIVHLGLGNFARAQLAEYVEDALEAGEAGWGIVGVSLQHPDQRDRLAPQDGLYTALQRDGSEIRPRIIGCVKRILVAPEEPAAVIGAMADESCCVVTLTVTEKGYCFDAGSGRLNFGHPVIQADLRDANSPRSVFGFLAAALRARRARHVPPFTTICCDNLPENGRLVANLLDEFVRDRDAGLADWIAENAAFPSTMVDRIVPAATEADLIDASAAIGLLDLAAVSHEPFRQLVIEERFAASLRASFEKVGVQFVGDVAAYERVKLRMLNCAHSTLAYLGCLSGYPTIRESAADPAFRKFVLDLWREDIIPVVHPPEGVDPFRYADTVMRRFDNVAILHKTTQVGSDGSQKLPVRLLPTIREQMARGHSIQRPAHVVAAWIRYLEGVDDRGEAIEVNDPLKDRLQAALASAGDTADGKVAAILSFGQIFGAELSDNNLFRSSVLKAYLAIASGGARAATAALVAT